MTVEAMADVMPLNPASFFSNIAVETNGSLTLTLAMEAATSLAVDVSTNLVSWSEIARFIPQTSPSWFTFEDTNTGSGLRFYRGIANPIELQVEVQADFPLPAGTTVTAESDKVVITEKTEFASKTFFVGTRFLPPADQYSIVLAAPGFISQTQTVSAAGIANGGHVLFSLTQAHSIAPTSLAGLSFDYVGGGAGTIAFSTNGNFYTWIVPGDFVETGTYAMTRTGSVWTVTTAAFATNSGARFVFTASDSGSILVSRSGFTNSAAGTFALSSHPELVAGLTPPPSISSITVRTDPQSLVGASVYVAQFSGASFVYTQGGGPGLTGPYQYQVTGPRTVHLVLYYSAPYVGDVDDLTLTFTGPGSGTLYGTSVAGGATGPSYGTFTNLH